MKRTWINNPIFIVGHPKSGTSLLTALFDSHKELMVLPEESDFYNQIWPEVERLYLKWRLSKEKKKEFLIGKILNDTHFSNYFKGKIENDISGNLEYEDFNTELLRKEITEGIVNFDFSKRSELLKSLVHAYTNTVYSVKDELTVKYWVEKTPKHLWFIDDIISDFPNAKFLFVYRDPRDNYLSYKKKVGTKLTSLKFSKNWNDSFSKVSGFSNEQVLLVKYEDLVLDSTQQMKRIANFLDIKNTPSLLSPTKNNKLWKGNSMFGSKSVSIDSSNLGRYKGNLPDKDLRVIEALCFQNMERYNYTRDMDEKLLEEFQSSIENDYKEFNPVRPNEKTLRQMFGKIRRAIIG